MAIGVMKIPYRDLTKANVSRPASVDGVIDNLNAQFYKWCEENEFPQGLLSQGILKNKLIYYAEKEIQKSNEKFKINSGWYLYGPCYEKGRRYESSESSPSIVPMTDRVSDEVSVVCKELVPRFYDAFLKKSVRRDFLGYIYSKKCDHMEICEYYQAKHGLQSQLWAIGGSSEIEYKSIQDDVSRAVIRFDSSLYDDVYATFAGLDPETVNQINVFGGLLQEHAEKMSRGEDSQAFFEVIDEVASRAILGLAHLNYSRTFEAVSKKYTSDIRDHHQLRADEILKHLREDNRRLYDAYGKTLAAGA